MTGMMMAATVGRNPGGSGDVSLSSKPGWVQFQQVVLGRAEPSGRGGAAEGGRRDGERDAMDPAPQQPAVACWGEREEAGPAWMSSIGGMEDGVEHLGEPHHQTCH